MPKLFTGPVELSEAATGEEDALFVGTTLRFIFRVSKDLSNPMENIFPEVKIEVARVGTWHQWQQHEVYLNSYLIGTVNLKEDSPTVLTFPFQPKLLKIDTKENYQVEQKNVNELIVKLGSGGFGLNDSFNVNWIELTNIEL